MGRSSPVTCVSGGTWNTTLPHHTSVVSSRLLTCFLSCYSVCVLSLPVPCHFLQHTVIYVVFQEPVGTTCISYCSWCKHVVTLMVSSWTSTVTMYTGATSTTTATDIQVYMCNVCPVEQLASLRIHSYYRRWVVVPPIAQTCPDELRSCIHIHPLSSHKLLTSASVTPT